MYTTSNQWYISLNGAGCVSQYLIICIEPNFLIYYYMFVCYNPIVIHCNFACINSNCGEKSLLPHTLPFLYWIEIIEQL